MNYQLFSKGIKQYQDFNTYLDNLKNAGLDLFETDLIEKAYSIFDTWIETILNEEGQDLIYWWLFEDVEKVITVDNEDINVAELEEFVKYLVDNGYTKDN